MTIQDTEVRVEHEVKLYFRTWWTALVFVVVLAHLIYHYIQAKKKESPTDTNEFLIDRDDMSHASAELDVDIRYRPALELMIQAIIRKDGLLKRRRDRLRLHYFSKETAIETLEDTGYRVLNYFYAPRSNEIGPNLIQKLFRVPRASLFAIHQDFAVRLLGGYTLMVLAQ